MGFKMKNVNVMGVHQFLGEEGHKKNNIYEELHKKGSLDNLLGAWQKIGRRVFWGGVDASMHTMT